MEEGYWPRPKLWWMDGVVEDLRKLGIQSWQIVARQGVVRRKLYGSIGSNGAVVTTTITAAAAAAAATTTTTTTTTTTKILTKSYIYSINGRMIHHEMSFKACLLITCNSTPENTTVRTSISYRLETLIPAHKFFLIVHVTP
jgi:hypothetical protein